MQTAKYSGTTKSLVYETQIYNSGSFRTDQIFEGVLLTRFLIEIYPEEETSVSIYIVNDQGLALSETYPKITAPMYLDLFSVKPLQLEIVGKCSVKIRSLRI